MAREALARRWLRYDAAYCAGAGLLALLLAMPLGRLFHVPALVLVAIGAATVAWAWLLARLARSDSWWQPVRIVGVANAVAAAGIAVLAVIAPATAARVLLVAVAVEVAAFATAQLRLSR